MFKAETRLIRFVGSSPFFVAILALFAIESIWIAISAAYPGVFDENTHFTIIKMYAHQWSPFVPASSTATDSAGALFRDPSYLYHYLMSFPYRLIALFTSNQMAQVIVLRFINIALFGYGLVLFRKLLLKTHVSRVVIHLALLFFILIPIVPLLAAEINYDNLVMPLTALALLLSVDIFESLRNNHQLPLYRSLVLVSLCLFTSLVQFEFLPVMAAIFLWLGWQIAQNVRSHRKLLWHGLQKTWRTSSSWRRLAVGVLPLLVMIGLFMQMYGLNVIAYHNLTPQCQQVLTPEQCQSDAAWVRNQDALAAKTHVNTDPLVFTAGWFYRLLVGMFYTSSGGAGPGAWYISVNPLPTLFGAVLLLLAGGLVLTVMYWRSLFRGYSYLGFLLFVAGLYAASLWLRNYHDFFRLGIKIAINGRYLLPILLPCIVVMILAYRQFLMQRRPQLRLAAVVLVLVLFLQGGGALTYIVSSNQNWYWHSGLSLHLNTGAQRIIRPLIVFKSPIHSFGRF